MRFSTSLRAFGGRSLCQMTATLFSHRVLWSLRNVLVQLLYAMALSLTFLSLSRPDNCADFAVIRKNPGEQRGFGLR